MLIYISFDGWERERRGMGWATHGVKEVSRWCDQARIHVRLERISLYLYYLYYYRCKLRKKVGARCGEDYIRALSGEGIQCVCLPGRWYLWF